MERLKKATEGLKKAMSKLIEDILNRRQGEANKERGDKCLAAKEKYIKEVGGDKYLAKYKALKEKIAELKKEADAAGLDLDERYGNEVYIAVDSKVVLKLEEHIADVPDYQKIREDLLTELNLASTYGDVDDIVAKAQKA